METNKKPLEVFNEFAKKRLENHLGELNTRYENEKINDETIKLAYDEHKKIYTKELEEKINSLLPSENNSGLKDELEKARNNFIAKLKPGELKS